MNDLGFVLRLLDRLNANGISAILFGGWAEELLRLAPPRLHHDVDLLYPAADFTALEPFLCQPDVQEVLAKRFSHKRAFLLEGVLVELLLLERSPSGWVTDFFSGGYSFLWHPTTCTWKVGVAGRSVPVASPAALRAYRCSHDQIEAAYRANQNQKQG